MMIQKMSGMMMQKTTTYNDIVKEIVKVKTLSMIMRKTSTMQWQCGRNSEDVKNVDLEDVKIDNHNAEESVNDDDMKD